MPQLDALRAIAVFMVLYSHLWKASGLGHDGVRLFFILSGFLITGILCRGIDAYHAARVKRRRFVFHFYIRRALRILPPFLIFLGAAWAFNFDNIRNTFVVHLAFLSNFHFAINNSWDPWTVAHFWTLDVEEQFYLIWPALILVVPRRTLPAILVGLIALSVIYRIAVVIWWGPSLGAYVLLPASLDALAAGSLLACVQWRPEVRRRFLQIGAVVGALYVVWYAVSTLNSVEAPFWLSHGILEGVWVAAFAALILAAANGIQGIVGRFLDMRWLRYLGVISYGIYVYHLLVLAVLLDLSATLRLDVPRYGIVTFAAAGAVTILVASVSWFAVERPLRGLRRRIPYVAQEDGAPGTSRP